VFQSIFILCDIKALTGCMAAGVHDRGTLRCKLTIRW